MPQSSPAQACRRECCSSAASTAESATRPTSCRARRTSQWLLTSSQAHFRDWRPEPTKQDSPAERSWPHDLASRRSIRRSGAVPCKRTTPRVQRKCNNFRKTGCCRHAGRVRTGRVQGSDPGCSTGTCVLRTDARPQGTRSHVATGRASCNVVAQPIRFRRCSVCVAGQTPD